MGQIIGTFYTWLGLEQIYGLDLANYLWGLTAKDVTTNQFIPIFFWTLGAAIAIAAIYYYVLGTLFQKPSWGNRFTWLISLGVNALVAFMIGWQWTLSDLYSGKMVATDPNTNLPTALPISDSNCLLFGFANLLISIGLYIIVSAILKWGSRDYSRIPL